MARKKWVIDERITRTPEERKWVESELNRVRTPEELKKKILSPTCNWSVSFNKGISKRCLTCLAEPEIYWKEVEEERDYGDSHFSEIKRAIIDQIKQNPQDWKIEEYDIWERIKNYDIWKEWEEKTKSGQFKDMTVTNYYKGYEPVYDTNGRYLYTDNGHKRHYKNGFTKEEWAEIENALNKRKDDNSDKNSITSNQDKEEGGNEKKPNKKSSSNNFYKQQIVNEIQKVKVEIEKLRNNKDIDSSESQASLRKKEEELKNLEQRLAEIKSSSSATQKPDNKKSIYYGIGIITLAVLIISAAVVWVKKKK